MDGGHSDADMSELERGYPACSGSWILMLSVHQQTIQSVSAE